MKLPQDVLQILESSHGRVSGSKQGAIQLGGVAQPAAVASDSMQGHRGEVSAQRAQLLEGHTSALPARTSQAQSGFAQVYAAASCQDVQVFAQSSPIELRERLGELLVGTSSRGSKPVVQKTHDNGRNLCFGRFPIEKCSTDVEIASLARQPGQLTQPLE